VRVKPKRLFLGNFIISASCILPQFIAHLLLYPDGSVIAFVYNLLLFTNPFYVFLYYQIFCRVFKLSRGDSRLSIEYLILAQFVNLLAFSFFANIWSTIINADYFAIIFPPDVLAMLSTDILFILLMVGYKRVITRSGRFIELPSGYCDDQLERSLTITFFSVASAYAILVTICTLLMQQYRVDISFLHAWLYFLLILIIVYRIFDNYRRLNIDILQWQKVNTQAYINSLLRAQNDYHGIKHDMNNILQVYNGYIQLDDMEALRRFHGSVLTTIKRNNTTMELLAALKERTVLYTLLDIKIQRASNLDVEISVNRGAYLIGITMNDLDLCRILGNLLDNAIDAAALSEKRHMEISCKKLASGHVQVEISNTTAGDVDINRIFLRDYTTKADGHEGRGLATVQNILALHEDCSMEVSYSNLRFCARINFATKETTMPPAN